MSEGKTSLEIGETEWVCMVSAIISHLFGACKA